MHLYFRLVGARTIGQFQYRASLAMRTLGMFLLTFVELITTVFLFNSFREMGGWVLGEVAFLYGLVSISLALSELISRGFDEVSDLVRTGEFDRLLIRPVSPYLQVLAVDLDLRQLGRLGQGILAIILALRWHPVAWTMPKALVFAVALLSTTLVFWALFVIGAAACFWTIERSEVQNAITYGGAAMLSYPIHIYRRWMQAIFLYFVPLGLTSFYPALFILDKPDPLGLPGFIPFLAPIVALAFFAASLGLWQLGLRHYQGTGS
jgi:ABC-2 type transport system permease protein